MQTATHLLTVEKFRALPEDGRRYELRNGERVEVTRPRLKHALIQRNLRRLMEAISDPASYVDSEVAFRPLPEYELRLADVAYIAEERWATADLEDNFCGVPGVVVEVLSPSNSASELIEKQELCLANGECEFWTIDPKRQTVTVFSHVAPARTYHAGDRVPFLAGFLPVDAIFA